MIRYRKLYPLFWEDEKIQALDPLDKLLAIYIFAGQQSNRIGLYCLSPGMAEDYTGIQSKRMGERFDGVDESMPKRIERVCRHLGWEWDPTTRVVYISTWWKYNTPENPNVLIGNLDDLDSVPHSYLVARFCENTAFLKPSLHETLRACVSKRLGKRMGKPSPNQEQEQEQEEEPLSGNSARRDTWKPGNTEAHQGDLAHEAESPAAPPPARPGHLKVVPDNTAAREILDYLNLRTGHGYEPVEANLKLIRARLSEPGRTVEQMRAVIDAKTAQWLKDPEWNMYLRPETLFGARKFAGYVGALVQGKAEPLPETPEAAYVRKQLTLMGEVVTLEQAKARLAKMVKVEGTHVG